LQRNPFDEKLFHDYKRKEKIDLLEFLKGKRKMNNGEFEIEQLKLCDRKRHAYEMKQRPNTHLRGRPKKTSRFQDRHLNQLLLRGETSILGVASAPTISERSRGQKRQMHREPKKKQTTNTRQNR
jgi:hypothetical protein